MDAAAVGRATSDATTSRTCWPEAAPEAYVRRMSGRVGSEVVTGGLLSSTWVPDPGRT
jgi:hypothetical protein